METRCFKYCVELKHDGADPLVRMYLDTTQVDMQWTNSSAGSDADVVPWDSSLLKSLTVNPKVFFDTHVPEEWSRVFLLALYRGHELGEQTNDNKSIWYSSNNGTVFAIVSPSVRTAAQNNIQSLQLRASKSKLINGDRQQNGILLVKTEVVQFEPRRQCETMAKFLVMPDKVHHCLIARYILCLTHLVFLERWKKQKCIPHGACQQIWRPYFY